ncbi:MAG: signal peptidase I [Oscillospiraceae bacterium]|nr:signal peptidase I [Oscillospiraceae bacterium]
MQNSEKRRRVKSAFEWADAVVSAVVIVVLLFTFLFRTIGVEGSSMVPTLANGDRLIVSHLFYEPEPGDVVVIVQPDSDTPAIIKRVIAVAGQTVDINFGFGTVTVDGKTLEEDYISEPTYMKRDVDFPVTVPEGCVFVMGDNRNRSLDSRDSSIGMVDQRYILGKAIFRLFPFDTIGLIQ